MQSCSSKLTWVSRKLPLLFVTLTITLSACSLSHETDPRQTMPELPVGTRTEDPIRGREGGLLQDLFTGSQGITACEWVTSLGKSREGGDRFQLLGDWDLPNAEMVDISGNLDASGSPLYSYALLAQTIPDSDEFMALIDQELEKTSVKKSFWKRVPILLGRFLMRMGWMDIYKQRNKIFHEKINEALPGIFSKTSERFKFRLSIPWAIFRAGNPDLERATTGRTSGGDGNRDILLRQWINHYTAAIPLFPGGTWQSVENDFRFGLSIAIRGLLGNDPAEKACSTVILHHSLGQLLSFTGYDRLPMGLRSDRQSAFLLDFPDLLDSPRGKTFMVCPTEGAFTLDGRRKILDRTALSTYDGDKISYSLRRTPTPPNFCERKDTLELGGDRYLRHEGELTEEFAGGTEWLSFASSMVHFMVAFNPGASWWRSPDTVISFPLSQFDSLDRIRASGAILPTDAHALSLALLNITVGSFRKNHLIMLDENNRETTDTKAVSKLRISQARHEEGNEEIIATTIRSATLLAEIAFKFADSLDKLAQWKSDAEASIQDEISREKDPKRRAALMRDFNDFIESMFGTQKTLKDLTQLTDDSIRTLLKDVKLATAMMVAAFAKPNYDCYASLLLDLKTGEEKKVGTCPEETKRLWKYTLKLIAEEYRAPLFEELAQ